MAASTDTRSTTSAQPPAGGRQDRASTAKASRHSIRLVWWREIGLIGIGYWLYSLIRNGVPAREAGAFQRADDIIAAEKWLHVYHELGFNLWVAAREPIAVFFNYYYATAHFAVTIGVGIWLYLRHPLHARALRTAWYVTNLVALFGFAFYSLAPPRLIPGAGFIDTVVVFHTWGSWGSGSVDSASNQFAAMPSMHIGWSLWCGLVIAHLARRRWVKVLGACYPALTLMVIIGTGNHYFLDAVGGAAALAVGFAVQRLISGRRAFGPRADGTSTGNDAEQREPTGPAPAPS